MIVDPFIRKLDDDGVKHKICIQYRFLVIDALSIGISSAFQYVYR